jgi:hypothetical protein
MALQNFYLGLAEVELLQIPGVKQDKKANL